MIKFIYPDGSYCYRVLHTVHAVFRDESNRLVARVSKPDGSFYIFEIKGFELLESGKVYN